MADIEIAKERLSKRGFSLVITKNGSVIFETQQSGVNGFILAIEKLGRRDLSGTSIADHVVGRAAALLCVYCHVKAVYALVLSEGGKRVLQDNGVFFEFGELVPSILNRQKTGTCPFEKMVSSILNADEAYERLKSCLQK